MKLASFIIRKILLVTFCILFTEIFFSSGLYAQAASVRFKIIAANPSNVRKQRVPIKVYLPEEVKPQDIIDLGGMQIEFDAERSLYYVFRNDIILQAQEVRQFEVEINDIWLIPEDDIDTTAKKVDYLLKAFEGSEYEEQMKALAKEFETLADEIIKTQADETLSRSQHIGAYRTNVAALGHLKEKLLEMERILKLEQGPLTPKMLTKTRFKTDSPTKTATWIVIFVIIFFLGLISIIVFFTWYRQGKATEKILSEAKKSAFIEFGDKEKDKEKKEGK